MLAAKAAAHVTVLLRPQAPYTGTLVAAQGGSSGFDMVGGTSFSTMPVDTSSTRQTPKIRELSCGGSLFLRRSQVPWPPFQTDYESGYLSHMAPQSSYLGYIDSLRAVAVLAVLFYHLNARLVPGGFVGVDIFFVISGFIVSRSFSAVQEKSFVNFVIHFYSRRLTSNRTGPDRLSAGLDARYGSVHPLCLSKRYQSENRSRRLLRVQ